MQYSISLFIYDIKKCELIVRIRDLLRDLLFLQIFTDPQNIGRFNLGIDRLYHRWTGFLSHQLNMYNIYYNDIIYLLL